MNRPALSRYPISICVACLMHMIWSIGLVFDHDAIHATGLQTVLVIAREPIWAAFLFGTVAFLAFLGIVVHQTWVRVILILPQQVVLWFSVVGAGHAMYLGQFADGTIRSHWFLIVDQVPVILIAMGHTAALLMLAERGDG